MSINFVVRFADNVSELKAHLREGLDQIETTRAAVDKLSRSLGGENVIRSAHNWTAALQEIGGAGGTLAGVQKLTAAETDRANAAIDRAVDKYKALGQAIPTPISELQKLLNAEVAATKSAEAAAVAQAKLAQKAKDSAASYGVLGSAFAQMTAAFSAASLINKAGAAITNLAQEALRTAGTLVDLSNKTGLSTETLQRMQFVAKQSGSDMTVFADAAFKMGVNVSEGTAKARGGAEALGLNWQALRAASPDAQFDMVVRALEKMEDPQKRNAAAVALFGKTAKEILPAIVDGYTKVAKEATVAGDAQVRASDRAADAADRFITRQVTRTMDFLGSLVLRHEAMNALTTDEREFVKYTALSSKEFEDWILHAKASTETIEKFDAALIKASDSKAKFGNIPGTGKPGADIDLPTEVKPPAPTSFGDDLKKAEAGYRALTAAKKDDIAAGLQLGATNDQIINQENITEGVLSIAKKAFEEHKTAMAKAAEAATVWAKVVTDIEGVGDDFRQTILQIDGAVVEWATHLLKSGADAKQVAAYYHLTESQIKALQQAIKADTEAEKDLSEIRNKFEAGTLDLNEALKKVNSTELIAIKEHLDLAKAMHLVEQSIPPVVAGFHGLGEDLTNIGLKSTELEQVVVHLKAVDKATAEAKARMATVSSTLDSLAASFTQLAQVSGGTFGGVAKDVGMAVVAAKQLVDAVKATSTAAAASQAKGGGFDPTVLASLAAGWVGVAVAIYSVATAFYNEAKAADEAHKASLWADELAAHFHSVTNFSLILSAALRQEADGFSAAENALAAVTGSTTKAFAEALHLTDVIKELGGMSALTADQLTTVKDRLRDLFVIAQAGGPLGARAIKQLDDTLTDMGQTAVSSGGLVDKYFLASIASADRLGIKLKGIDEFLQGQTSAAETGLAGALAVTNDAYAKRKDLQTQIAALGTSDADKTKLKELTAQLETQNQIIDATAIHSQAAADAVGAGLVGILNSQILAGKSFHDSILAIAPSVDALSAQMIAAGFTGGSAFDSLRAQVALATDAVAGPALTAVEGYAAGLRGLNNAGLLNQDTFAGMSSQIGQTEAALVAQGKDGGQVLSAMRGPLQTMWELEQKFGYTTDEATQKLIDQAAAQGLVGEQFKSVDEQMLDATNRIANAVELLAEVFGVLPKAASDAADGINSGLGRVQVPTLPGVTPGAGGQPPTTATGPTASQLTASSGTLHLDVVMDPTAITDGMAQLTIKANEAMAGLKTDLTALPKNTQDATDGMTGVLAQLKGQAGTSMDGLADALTTIPGKAGDALEGLRKDLATLPGDAEGATDGIAAALTTLQGAAGAAMDFTDPLGQTQAIAGEALDGLKKDLTALPDDATAAVAGFADPLKQLQIDAGASFDGLKDDVTGLPTDAKTAADGISDELAKIKIPTITIPIVPSGSFVNGVWTPTDVVYTNRLPGFATGSGGIRDFGLGTNVTLHGREAVFTEDQLTAPSSVTSTHATPPTANPLVGDTYHIAITGFNGTDILRTVRSPEFVEALVSATAQNKNGMGTGMRAALQVDR